MASVTIVPLVPYSDVDDTVRRDERQNVAFTA